MADNFQVLLTTSGLGQRLGDLTKYTNKSLVRVGKKPAISYIIESYPLETEFVITLGHFGNQVKQFLELVYPNRKFQFVWVDNYDGPGSSLAYSILQAKSFINQPFIFHACDTVVLDQVIPAPNKNWLGGFKTKNSSNYVSFDVNGKELILKDKGELNYDYSYIGLAGIYDYQLFFQKLEDIYQANPSNGQLSDVAALKAMKNFEAIEFKNWLDIGNADGLKKARELIPDHFEILDKLEESIFIFDNFVVKFFYDSKICQNRVERAKLLGNLVPEIINSTENFYQYTFAPGKLMAQDLNEVNFEWLLYWAKEKLWIWQPEATQQFSQTCYDFYYKKTKERINKYLNGKKDEDCIINNIKIPPIESLLSVFPDYQFCDGEPYQFHGDFILDNIILTENGFKLLDWRQDFGGDLKNGDIYYDLAKMNHNLIFNHDIVNKNLFTIEIGKEIQVDILRSHHLVKCQEILKEFIKENGFSWWKVEILTALIWLNMAPLHHYPLNNFLFYFGKFNLFKARNG